MPSDISSTIVEISKDTQQITQSKPLHKTIEKLKSSTEPKLKRSKKRIQTVQAPSASPKPIGATHEYFGGPELSQEKREYNKWRHHAVDLYENSWKSGYAVHTLRHTGWEQIGLRNKEFDAMTREAQEVLKAQKKKEAKEKALEADRKRIRRELDAKYVRTPGKATKKTAPVDAADEGLPAGWTAEDMELADELAAAMAEEEEDVAIAATTTKAEATPSPHNASIDSVKLAEKEIAAPTPITCDAATASADTEILSTAPGAVNAMASPPDNAYAVDQTAIIPSSTSSKDERKGMSMSQYTKRKRGSDGSEDISVSKKARRDDGPTQLPSPETFTDGSSSMDGDRSEKVDGSDATDSPANGTKRKRGEGDIAGEPEVKKARKILPLKAASQANESGIKAALGIPSGQGDVSEKATPQIASINHPMIKGSDATPLQSSKRKRTEMYEGDDNSGAGLTPAPPVKKYRRSLQIHNPLLSTKRSWGGARRHL